MSMLNYFFFFEKQNFGVVIRDVSLRHNKIFFSLWVITFRGFPLPGIE